MKVLQFVFVFMLISIICFGQEKQSEYETKIKYTPSKIDFSKSTTHSSFVKNSEVINGKKEAISKHIKPGIDNVVGKVLKNDTCTFYSKRGASLIYYMVSGNDSLIGNGGIFLPCITKEYEIVESFTNENVFYVFTAKRRSKELNLYKFIEKGIYEHNVISVKPEISNLLIKNKLRTLSLFDKCDPEFFNSTVSNLYDLCNKYKCNTICKNNKFIIVLDEYRKNTLLTINLETGQTHQEVFEFGKNKNTTISIFEDKMFQLVTSRDSLSLYISSIIDGSIIKKYSVSSNDSLFFSNGPLYKNFQGYGNKVKYYDFFKKSLYDLSERITILIIDKINNSYKIGIGTKKCYKKAGNVILDLLDRAAAQQTGGVYIKSAESHLVFGVYFECFFDSETLEHKEGIMPPWKHTPLELY